MQEKEIRKYISVIRRALSFIEANLEDDQTVLEELVSEPVAKLETKQVQDRSVPKLSKLKMQEAAPVTLPVQPPKNMPLISPERRKHISDLMTIDCWPEAVQKFCLTEPSDIDQANRADSVLDYMISTHMEGKTFLDFGCGDGWIAKQAMMRGVSESTGFDISPNPNWAKFNGPIFAENVNQLKPSHYDIVMLYDVLDHCDNPVNVMSQIRNVLKPTGIVYVRCHPWTSKHATHVYKQGLNKAYIHLFLAPFEIREVTGQPQMFVRQETAPIEAYRRWFDGFNIKKEQLIKDGMPISPFFLVPAFKELLANEQQIDLSRIDAFLALMETQFVDYQLTLK